MTVLVFFFFKQKTAYEMRISDWSSDGCSSDLLYALLREIDVQGPIESLHDAAQFFADAQAQYAMGLLDLPQRAYAERAYYALARAVLPKLDLSIRAQRDAYDELREKLSAKYFCNFSVFQSVPDAWAIDQVFPIMPIHRLDERPDVRARLCDLTCDSDGRQIGRAHV